MFSLRKQTTNITLNLSHKSIFKTLSNRESTLAVIGLGYVGLPLALAFGKHFNVIGYDIDKSKIASFNKNIDPNKESPKEDFLGKTISFTDNVQELKDACCYIITVPTPVTRFNVPNLGPLEQASEMIGFFLNKGDLVVYESTVYPGCTEEDCVPILEKYSGLKMGADFKVGYSPERINPGDKVRRLENTVKLVSGSDADALEDVAAIYETIIEAGVHRTPNIKVAEAAKIIENTQRDLNIALMNELSMIFDKVGISTMDVIDAAATKWNFLKFYPGLVGGHCIGVDPYYLTHKAVELGYTPEIILSGRKVNDNLSRHVVRKAIQLMGNQGKNIQQAKVLVMGITFKENVSDVRNSKVVEVVKELEGYNLHIDVIDPHVNAEHLFQEYGVSLTQNIGDDYDSIIVAVKHKEYTQLSEAYFQSITNGKGVLIDIKSQYRNQITEMDYWAL